MRLNERSLVVWIGGGLAAAIVLAVVVFLLVGGGDDEAGSGDSSSGDESFVVDGNAAASLEGGPDEILYLSGTSLVRRNLDDGEEEPIGMPIESATVEASPGSHWIAYVSSKVSGEDFVPEPVLHLYDPENDEKAKLGAGVAPVWNPSGTHVAYLAPTEPRDCEGETCSGDVQIGVTEAETGEESLLLDAGRYTVLGWAGERVIVGDFDDPTTVTAVSLDDDRQVLGMPASQYWEASPDGRWVVKTNAKKTEFLSLGEKFAAERVTVDLGDYQLLEGAWAHDSSRVAAVVGVRGEGGNLETRIVTFSPEDPKPETIAGTFGATGTVLWSVDNDSIVFASLLDPKRALFQAQHCSLGNETGCAIVTSWTEGVTLLRTE